MKEQKTLQILPDVTGFSTAAKLLADGGLVAFPTETVYGLGADARNGEAVARIYAAKGRPSFNPLIVHVPSLEAAQEYVVIDDTAKRLAAAFWPGALSLVLPLKPDSGVSELVTAGLPTLAIRVPDHPVAQELLNEFNGPVAAPSANPSGRVSPTTADHVLAGLDGKIDGVLDAGPCPVGLESTIVSCADRPALLRAGGVPVEVIEAALGQSIARPDDPDTPQSPGQLASHYAPHGSVRLNATAPTQGETFVGFGKIKGDLSLSKTGDLIEAAANLFSVLHQLDAMGATRIAIAPIPKHGLGAAINDRLKRAAAPR